MFDAVVKYEGPHIRRKAAKDAGLRLFFTGRPCKRGHIDQRRVATGLCLSCQPFGVAGNPFHKKMRAEYVPHHCLHCSAVMPYQKRNQEYCSYKCSNAAGANGAKQIVSKACRHCALVFKSKSAGRYCSDTCRTAAAIAYSSTTRRYLMRMLLLWDRRKNLTIDDLLALYERQEGKCAISGTPMTSLTGIGKVKTNISLDQIRPGQGYTPDNVQLVCIAVNNMKWDWPQEEFLGWCRKIVIANGGLNAKHLESPA